MEHAKKWMLVDPSVDLRNVKRHYGALDQNISNVLNRQDVDDREKLRLYQTALNKFLNNRQSVESELNKPVEVELSKTGVDQKSIIDQLLSLLTAKTTAEPKVEEEEEKQEAPTRKKNLPPSSPQRGRRMSSPSSPPRRTNRKRREKRLSPSTWITYR
jgi:hypothetical protein